MQRTLDEEPVHYPWYVAERYCVDPVGSVSATFDLEWSTDLEGDPFVADATLSAEAYGESLVDDYVGGLAGPDEYGTPLVLIMGIDAGFTEVSQAILILPPSLEPGAYDIDIAAIPGYMLTIMLDGSEPEVVSLMGGEVVFDEVSLVPGGRVSGSLDAILIPNIFE